MIAEALQSAGNRPGRHDPDSPPEPKPCPACKRLHPWVWWDPQRPGWRAQWAAPRFESLDPVAATDRLVCEWCRDSQRRLFVGEQLQAACELAGIPAHLRRKLSPSPRLVRQQREVDERTEEVLAWMADHEHALRRRPDMALELLGPQGQRFVTGLRGFEALAVDGDIDGGVTAQWVRDTDAYRLEPDDSHTRRVRAAGEKALGIRECNAETWLHLQRWVGTMRDTGTRYGVLLHGPVGTGKSQVAAVAASQLLQVGAAHRVEWGPDALLPDGRRRYPTWAAYERARRARRNVGYTRPRSVPVAWHNEAELLRREQLSWKADGLPLFYAVRSPGVLVLDDLGASSSRVGNDGQPGPGPTWAVECVEKLICARYDAELPMLVTTNLHPDDLPVVLGKRAASRLRDMCHPFEWGGETWRRG